MIKHGVVGVGFSSPFSDGCGFIFHIFILYRLEVLVPCVDLIGKGGGDLILVDLDQHL